MFVVDGVGVGEFTRGSVMYASWLGLVWLVLFGTTRKKDVMYDDDVAAVAG